MDSPEADLEMPIHVKMVGQEVLSGKKKNSMGVGKRDMEEKEVKQISDVKQNPMKGNLGSTP